MEDGLSSALFPLLALTGRAVARVLSLGRWRSEPALGREGRVFGAAGNEGAGFGVA